MSSQSIKQILYSLAQKKSQKKDLVLNDEMTCDDAGLDSLDLIEISYELEEIYQIEIDPAKMGGLEQTMAQFAERMEALIGSEASATEVAS